MRYTHYFLPRGIVVLWCAPLRSQLHVAKLAEENGDHKDCPGRLVHNDHDDDSDVDFVFTVNSDGD